MATVAILTFLYQFVQFCASHQSGIAIYAVFAIGLAGYLLSEARHELRPRLAYVPQPQVIPPINLLIHCSDASGKWTFEVKRVDWSA